MTDERRSRGRRRRAGRTLVVAVAVVVAVATVAPVVSGAADRTTGADASGVPAAADATAATTHADPVEIEEGEGYFVGQTLTTDAFAGEDSVALYRDGAFVRELVVENGTVTLDTDGFEATDYSLRAGLDERLNFSLREQTLSATATPDTVDNAGETVVDLTVRSNRVGFTYVLEMSGVDAADLQSAIGEGRVADGDADDDPEVLVDGGTIERTFDLDVAGLAVGDYEVTVRALDAEAVASTTVTVEEPTPLVSVEPRDASASVGGETNLTVTVDRAFDGVSDYRVRVRLDNGSVGEVTAAGDLTDGAAAGATILPEGDAVVVGAAPGPVGDPPIDLAAVTVRGETPGETDVTVIVERLDDDGGDAYPYVPEDGTLTVTAGVDVDDDGAASTDRDGDGRHEDVDGDDDFDTADVQALLDDLVEDGDAAARTDLFDFDGDDEVGTGDVQALLDDLVRST